MFALPSPLHPALVHFPIVLILIGAAVALAALFIPKQGLAWLAAALLSCGAIGAVAAVWSGGKEGEMAGELPPVAELALDQHEDWAERTRTVSLLAAGLAVAGAVLRRRPAALAVAALTVFVAGGAAFCVIQTGHRGGQMVYRHGIGINTTRTADATATATPEQGEREED